MRYVLMALGIPACLGLGYFVYQDSLSRRVHTKKPEATEAIAVQVTRVRKQTMTESVQLVGRLQPIASVTIRARVAGYLTRLPKDVGDEITAGHLVVELDNSKHRQSVGQAEAVLKIANAQLKAFEARKSLAAKDVVLYEKRAKDGGSTAQQLGAARSQLEIAAAEVELEESRVEEADAALKRAKLSLGETKIVSPLTGVVAKRLVEVGDLANPNDPLVQIIELTKVRLIASVVEKDYEKVKRGQPVSIRVDAFPGETFVGTVTRKAPVIDQETQTAVVQIEINNPKLRLKPGMTARAKIILRKHKDASVVPVASLLDRDDRAMLYVVEGSPPRTRIHEIQTGIRDGDMIEVLDGIGPNDGVGTLGSRLVESGQTVTPVETPTPVTFADRAATNDLNQTGD